MSSLKINLRSGAASLAQFVGIGKGIAPAAAQTSRSFVAIGGSPSARAKGNRAEDPDNQEDAPPAHDPALAEEPPPPPPPPTIRTMQYSIPVVGV